MAGSFKSNNTTYGVRSISLPTSSHPLVDSVKKALHDVESWVILSSSCKPSIESIYDGLLKLSTLYECMHEVINVLCSTQDKKHVEELMDKLVGFLDVCGIMRDIMSRYKEHIRDLQCALRRQKRYSNMESSIARYSSFRKTVKKDVKRLMASLKQYSMVVKSQDSHHDHDDHLLITMVMEVSVSVFESLLMPFVMSNSQTPKTSKWSTVVSKLIQRTRVACEEHGDRQTNDIESLDVVLRRRCIEADQVSSWWNDECIWVAMEAQIERIEGGLECIFRTLVRTRASLLNIISDYGM